MNDVAKNLNITREALYKKCNGMTEFKASEIAKLIKLLRLTNKETRLFFFM